MPRYDSAAPRHRTLGSTPELHSNDALRRRGAPAPSPQQLLRKLPFGDPVDRLDGYLNTAAIRKLEHGNQIPIVGLTANALHGDRQRCLDAGMNDYLAKPVNRNDLLQMLAH
ncbi:MAG: response regulator [Rhodobacterales bacterium]|nr:response regulator [Rhodobacterales bacterium]